jgi:acetolactate synthase-1/2/3 large subunit
MTTGAELFVEAARELGLTRIFTLVGDHLNEVLREAARRNFDIVDMRHESAVTHAADAWARITRRPALALVTGGPGHTNSLTGIATANLAGSPLIAVSGGCAGADRGRQAFQDIDQAGTARPIVKWAAEAPGPAQLPFFLRRAYAEAVAGRMGAVHLTIPVDAFTGSVREAPPLLTRPERAAPAATPTDIERAIALLKAARKPVVIAGSGVWWAQAGDELRTFAELTSLPVYTITMARGVLPDDHPLSMGYADPALNRGAAAAFREADLFLVLGKRIDYRLALGSSRVFPPAAKFVQVDIHPRELGLNRPVDLGICADVRAALRGLIDFIGKRPWPELEWLGRVRELRRQWRDSLDAAARDTSAPLHPAAFFAELSSALPPGILYSWDGGDFAHWGRAMLPALEPGGWLRLGPLGTIGASLPNAIALKMAHPDRPVMMITGDGALGFYIAELDTAVRYKLPFVIVVGNDAGWGLEREMQGKENTVAVELRRTRYDVVMQGFGGEGETIDSLDQVRPAVERAFASGRPYLLNVNIRGARSPFTDWRFAMREPVA